MTIMIAIAGIVTRSYLKNKFLDFQVLSLQARRFSQRIPGGSLSKKSNEARRLKTQEKANMYLR